MVCVTPTGGSFCLIKCPPPPGSRQVSSPDGRLQSGGRTARSPSIWRPQRLSGRPEKAASKRSSQEDNSGRCSALGQLLSSHLTLVGRPPFASDWPAVGMIIENCDVDEPNVSLLLLLLFWRASLPGEEPSISARQTISCLVYISQQVGGRLSISVARFSLTKTNETDKFAARRRLLSFVAVPSGGCN